MLRNEQQDPTIFLAGIAEISKAIMEKQLIEDILALIVSVTAKVMESSIVSILLVDKKKGELVLRACHMEGGQYRQRSNTPIGRGIAGRVAASNKPLSVLDVRKDTRFLNRKIAIEDGLVSLLSVPMSIEGLVMGVINCYTAKEREFTDGDIQMLTTVASQAAVIIRNTELRIMKEIVEKELEERKLIDRAKEILQDKKGISAQKAFEMIRTQSMNTRTNLAKISESIILAASFD